MTTVDSWPKTLPMMSVGSWNSTTETHLMLISFSGRTKQIFFLVIKLEPRLLSWLQPRKINFAPTELNVSISAGVIYFALLEKSSTHFWSQMVANRKRFLTRRLKWYFLQWLPTGNTHQLLQEITDRFGFAFFSGVSNSNFKLHFY